MNVNFDDPLQSIMMVFSGAVNGKLDYNLFCLHRRLHCLKNFHRPGKKRFQWDNLRFSE